MSKGFKHGAGGADLNFKVAGGTEQPENPRENTIWVSTDTAVSGWVFSPEEPESPSGGLVWIALGTASPAPFNALKKNGLFVDPLSCAQYVSGTWERKTAYVYKAGTWVQFSSPRPEREYLIQDGVIDMTAHPHDSTNYVDSVKYNAENGVDYSGNAALQLGLANGALVGHTFSNVAVPDWAATMVIQYYLLAAYEYDPTFLVGEASVSVSRGSASTIGEGTAQLDVTGIAGTTVEFTVKSKGFSGCGANYIGNAWFE